MAAPLPQPPAVGGVAASAVLAEIAFVHIVMAMAADALVVNIVILPCQVALLARDRHVQSHEREAREVVVERDVCAPALRCVALVAASAERAEVHIACLVAADTVRAELLGGDRRGVTDVTADLGVLADQRPLRIARVIEGRGLPGLVAVAFVALLTEATGV